MKSVVIITSFLFGMFLITGSIYIVQFWGWSYWWAIGGVFCGLNCIHLIGEKKC